MPPLLVALLVLASACAAPGPETFVGTITDEMCPDGTHDHMRMGPTDAECTTACILAHGARYVLYDGRRTYILSDQETPEQFAAQTVRVTGVLDPESMTIDVESIAATP